MNEISLVPVNDAGKILGVGKTTVWKYVGLGQLELVHIGRKALITKTSLTAFVASLPRRSAEPASRRAA